MIKNLDEYEISVTMRQSWLNTLQPIKGIQPLDTDQKAIVLAEIARLDREIDQWESSSRRITILDFVNHLKVGYQFNR
jgi:hypothetical protein